MCNLCEIVKEKHKDYNICPYCGKSFNTYGFVSKYKFIETVPVDERDRRIGLGINYTTKLR